MKTVMNVFLLVLFMLRTVTAQHDKAERVLEPWMTGITAVAIFLFLVFVAFIVNKAWCDSSSNEPEASGRSNEYIMTNENTYSTALDMVRINEGEKAFDNVTAQGPDEIVTPM